MGVRAKFCMSAKVTECSRAVHPSGDEDTDTGTDTDTDTDTGRQATTGTEVDGYKR